MTNIGKVNAKIGVTEHDWEQRRKFVGFTTEDVVLLKELRSTLEACIDEVVDKLYEQFLEFEETKAFFTHVRYIVDDENFDTLVISHPCGLLRAGWAVSFGTVLYSPPSVFPPSKTSRTFCAKDL